MIGIHFLIYYYFVLILYIHHHNILLKLYNNYHNRYSDITIDLANNDVQIHKMRTEPWTVTMLYTGQKTMTGGRIKRIQKYVGDESFYLTYGDAVSDVNIADLTKFHKAHGKCVTITSVSIAQQKGVLDMDKNNTIIAFREKDDEDGAVVNGGFMICNPGIFDYLQDDTTILEQGSITEFF